MNEGGGIRRRVRREMDGRWKRNSTKMKVALPGKKRIFLGSMSASNQSRSSSNRERNATQIEFQVAPVSAEAGIDTELALEVNRPFPLPAKNSKQITTLRIAGVGYARSDLHGSLVPRLLTPPQRGGEISSPKKERVGACRRACDTFWSRDVHVWVIGLEWARSRSRRTRRARSARKRAPRIWARATRSSARRMEARLPRGTNARPSGGPHPPVRSPGPVASGDTPLARS